jgi:hypothetical protein
MKQGLVMQQMDQAEAQMRDLKREHKEMMDSCKEEMNGEEMLDTCEEQLPGEDMGDAGHLRRTAER